MTASGKCYLCGHVTGHYHADAELWHCGCTRGPNPTSTRGPTVAFVETTATPNQRVMRVKEADGTVVELPVNRRMRRLHAANKRRGLV